MDDIEQSNSSSKIQNQEVKIPGFQRDIFPTNIALSAQDLCELSDILQVANEDAIKLEINAIDSDVDDHLERVKNIKTLMKVQYVSRSQNGDNIVGIGKPTIQDLPDKMSSFFISTDANAREVVNASPLNHVNAFLSFETPNLQIDMINVPSNPTENRSVINVVGRDENWVRATASKLEEFFSSKKTIRPVLHGAGAYDFFLFFLYLPLAISLLASYDEIILSWLVNKSVFFNVISGIYAFFVSLIFARILFQLARWIFPPIEYFKTSRTRANTIRAVTGFVLSSLFLSALYDLFKYFFQ